MRILVLGATGRTGRLVTRAALTVGHEVTVLVRDPSRLESGESLRVIRGDATIRDDVARALQNQEGMISALGAPSVLTSDIATPAAANFVALARAGQVRRMIVMSAFGVGETSDQAGLLVRAAFSTVLRSLYRDKTIADDLVRRSGLDWTIVHPVTLTDDPATGQVTATERLIRGQAMSVGRADVAEFMVASLVSSDWSRKTVIISSQPTTGHT